MIAQHLFWTKHKWPLFVFKGGPGTQGLRSFDKVIVEYNQNSQHYFYFLLLLLIPPMSINIGETVRNF